MPLKEKSKRGASFNPTHDDDAVMDGAPELLRLYEEASSSFCARGLI